MGCPRPATVVHALQRQAPHQLVATVTGQLTACTQGAVVVPVARRGAGYISIRQSQSVAPAGICQTTHTPVILPEIQGESG